MIKDYLSGEMIPNVGAEANRQQLIQFLVEQKEYQKTNIGIDVPLSLVINDATYQSCIDVIITIEQIKFMAIKCAAGSLDSRQREIVAAARIAFENVVPWPQMAVLLSYGIPLPENGLKRVLTLSQPGLKPLRY
jgi:hypothetical protein